MRPKRRASQVRVRVRARVRARVMARVRVRVCFFRAVAPARYDDDLRCGKQGFRNPSPNPNPNPNPPHPTIP